MGGYTHITRRADGRIANISTIEDNNIILNIVVG